ncbi:DUF4249 domain-containing protein [Pseudochryseolinea flava]|uniref:DUF4249 domain-containing protein n=1 Tax=Pseudochryseolinea flava TaxID=2059302 RepID=A0A364Y872_9BACT|nr:DUF4249 domain-containing protein [Pseudochryseolinea flava]RAW03314.1 hypothetical protein DQQ10_04310 [Pseudochryseolinea flava]
MKKRAIIFGVVIVIVASSCVDKFDLSGFKVENHLVVDGLITNDHGPYTVELYMSSGIGDNVDHPEYVTDAIVTIKNDLGESEILSEASDGIYRTAEDGLQGEIGRKYQLLIELPDGRSFQSPMDEMKAPGNIDDLFFEFKANSINGNDIALPQDAFWVYLNSSSDGSDDQHLFRWRWNGTYKIKTYPELHVVAVGNSFIPRPFPCSGYIVEEGNVLQKIRDCTCCECWKTEYGGSALISKNEFLEGGNFRRVPITKVPILRKIFEDGYYVQVEQMRISESAYNFWKLAEAYQASGGNIFQPNAVQIKGNISSTEGSDEVFGVFSVAGVTRKGVFLHRWNIPYGLAEGPIVTSPCYSVEVGATTTKPIFW